MNPTILRGPWLCRQCLREARLHSARVVRSSRGGATTQAQRRHRSDVAASDDQAIPLSGYYAGKSIDGVLVVASDLTVVIELLSQPLHKVAPATRTMPEPPPAPRTAKEETLAKARIVFGSRLTSPNDRAEAKRAESQLIAGVRVPPRPVEPDNCCMSGCVNCVWDLYRDDMEEWAAKNAEARAALQAQRQSGQATGMMGQGSGTPTHVAISMDDDGGGSETNWDVGSAMNGQSADLFAGIPVGIREFMRTEKMLKEKHIKEGQPTVT